MLENLISTLRTPFKKEDPPFLVSAILFNLANLTDLVSTRIGLAFYPIVEGNSLARYIMDNYGNSTADMLKIFISFVPLTINAYFWYNNHKYLGVSLLSLSTGYFTTLTLSNTIQLLNS